MLPSAREDMSPPRTRHNHKHFHDHHNLLNNKRNHDYQAPSGRLSGVVVPVTVAVTGSLAMSASTRCGGPLRRPAGPWTLPPTRLTQSLMRTLVTRFLSNDYFWLGGSDPTGCPSPTPTGTRARAAAAGRRTASPATSSMEHLQLVRRPLLLPYNYVCEIDL